MEDNYVVSVIAVWKKIKELGNVVYLRPYGFCFVSFNGENMKFFCCY